MSLHKTERSLKELHRKLAEERPRGGDRGRHV